MRHAQVCHPIQGGAPNARLGGLGRHLPTAQAVTEDRFLAEHHRFGQTPAMVVHLLLPGWSPNLANPPHRLLARIPLADIGHDRILARWVAGRACRASIA